MSVHENLEYQNSTENAIKKYEKVFGEGSFPDFYFEYEFDRATFENKIVEAINECLENDKDVYEMKIVPLTALETSY